MFGTLCVYYEIAKLCILFAFALPLLLLVPDQDTIEQANGRASSIWTSLQICNDIYLYSGGVPEPQPTRERLTVNDDEERTSRVYCTAKQNNGKYCICCAFVFLLKRCWRRSSSRSGRITYKATTTSQFRYSGPSFSQPRQRDSNFSLAWMAV